MENQEKPKRKYKKRTRKTTPKVGVLSGTSEEVKNIPLYDPYTGEPNPYYEELTGKPNPLMQPKPFTIDGVAEKSRKELLGLPKTKYEIDTEPSDVKTNNRFLVIFPEELGIKPKLVKNVTRPTVRYNKYTFGRDNVTVSSLRIDFIDFIDENFKINVKLNDLLKDNKKFDVRIETLNPKNLVIEEMILTDCYISELSFSGLSYSDDNLSTTTIELQPREFSIV